jgi:hypothetical protein
MPASVLLITYDLNREGKSKVDYNKFYEIRDKYDHVRLSESSYAFHTNETPQDVYNKLKPVIDSNDYLLIINLKRPYFGFHIKTAIDWLEQRLAY